MAPSTTQPTDHWSSSAYSTAAPFVPRLTAKILQYLSPQPSDHILDLGCGDAKFTANYLPHIASVVGVDASPSFIASAQSDYGAPNAIFRLLDCRFLDEQADLTKGGFDKVVSNAALHWILREPATRMRTLQGCFAALKPGGTFVFEMGGAGNVAEAHAALLGAVRKFGGLSSIAEAREADPWFFPSEKWMEGALREVGFEVDRLELEYRPTRLTEESGGGGGGGGLEGWVRLFGASMLERVQEEGGRRDEAVREVCEVLETVVRRVEDGSRWLGYVRLRGLARRPA